jgi:hypothetical protein
MAIIVNMFFPPVAPLITMLMLGNLLKEVLMVHRLARTAGGGLMNVITITLTLAIGSTMCADIFVPSITADRRSLSHSLPLRHRVGRADAEGLTLSADHVRQRRPSVATAEAALATVCPRSSGSENSLLRARSGDEKR